MDEGQFQSLEQEWAGTSVLPLLAKLIEDSRDVRELALLLLDDTLYRSREDHVLAALVPEFKPLIERFYAKGGKPLTHCFSDPVIKKIDHVATRRIPDLVPAWVEVRKQIYMRDGTTKEAVGVFRSLLMANPLFDFGGSVPPSPGS